MSDTRHPRPPKRSAAPESAAARELRARTRLWGALADLAERVVTLLDIMIEQEKEERGA